MQDDRRQQLEIECKYCRNQLPETIQVATAWKTWHASQPATRDRVVVELDDLASVLSRSGRSEEALPIFEAALALCSRDIDRMRIMNSMARCYERLGRTEDQHRMQLEGLAYHRAEYAADPCAPTAKLLVYDLLECKQYDEATEFMRKILPLSINTHGREHENTLHFAFMKGVAIMNNSNASKKDLREAEALFEDLRRRMARDDYPTYYQNASREGHGRVRARLAAGDHR